MYPVNSEDTFGIAVKEQVESLRPNVDMEVFNLRLHGTIYRYTVAQLQVIKRILLGNYSTIHIHYGISGLFLLLYKPSKSKVIVTFHGSDILKGDNSFSKKIQTFLSKWISRKADQVIIVSEQMRSSLPVTVQKFERCAVIPCGISLSFFAPSQKDGKGYGVEKTIIFPSDPTRKEKNFILFQEVLKLVKASGLLVKTVILMNMSRDEVRTALVDSDMMILTSTSEGSPQVIKEAMATNLPVVSVDVGTVKELVDGVDLAFVVRDYSAKEMAEKVIYGLSQNRKSMNGREQLVNLGIDLITVAERIELIYE